jgi:DNA-binding XRE family transcriptional regulator
MSQKKLNERVIEQYQNRVRECRLRALVAKQDELAKLTGISRTVVSGLENNRIFLSAPYALVIAECLGCKLDELYEKKGSGMESSVA